MNPHLISLDLPSISPFVARPSPDPIQRLALKGLGTEAPDNQVVAHFEALEEGVLIAALKSTGYLSPFQFPLN